MTDKPNENTQPEQDPLPAITRHIMSSWERDDSPSEVEAWREVRRTLLILIHDAMHSISSPADCGQAACPVNDAFDADDADASPSAD